MSLMLEGARSWLTAWQPVRMPPEKEAAFDRHAREQFARYGVALASLCMLGALLWWPADYLIYWDLPQWIEPTHKWRAVAIVVGMAYFALVRLGPIRPLQRELLIGSGLVLSAAMGWATGLGGGPDRPQAHMPFMMIMGTIPMPLSLRTRVLVTLAFAGAVLGGFLLPFPEYVSSPYLPTGISYMTLTSSRRTTRCSRSASPTARASSATSSHASRRPARRSATASRARSTTSSGRSSRRNGSRWRSPRTASRASPTPRARSSSR
jgi:hypothetical protein